jgi:hypothetical protein
MARRDRKSTSKPVVARAENFSITGPDCARPSANMPEFVVIMLEAIRHFGINQPAGIYPKKNPLIAYFRQRRLSNGSLISLAEAKHLATFCRPVAAKSGGNKRRVEPLNR